MPKKIVRTTQSEINKMVASGKSIRVGFTNNASRRASEYNHAKIGKSTTMYVASTSNGRTAEQRLLSNQFSNAKTNKNVQRNSNITGGTHGIVYALVKK